MARNALEAVFGALGGGLVGYGKDKNLRMDREEERLARELAARQSAEQRRIGLFNAGLDEEQPLRQQATTTKAAGLAAGAIPMTGTIGSALDVASRQMDSNITRGRGLEVDGKRYVQPYDRTPQGLAEAARRQAESDASVTRQQRLEDEEAKFKREQEGRIELAQVQGAQGRLTQAERPVPFNPRANEGWRGALPVASKNRLEMSEASLNQLAYLKQAVAKRPDAVGLKNYAPGAAIDRLDPQGADIRATIELISGEIRNARFGGALTKTEAEFALRSLPDARQRADVVLSRITALERFLEERRRGVFSSYNQPYAPFQTTDLTNAGAGNVGDVNPLAVGGSAADRLRSGGYP